MVEHLKWFPGFDSKRMYPFDLEDALLTWLNQCIVSIKTDERNQQEYPWVKDVDEMEELAQDVMNRMLWVRLDLVPLYYFW